MNRVGCLLVAACASTSAVAADDWVKQALKTLPQHFESVMRPGCLLPDPAVLQQARLPRATLYVSVNTEGRIDTARVMQGTGEPSVDAAIIEAARGCSFEPKYILTPPSNLKTTQVEFRELAVQWPVPVSTWGAHRCFPPEYTHAVRRLDAQGTVTVVATKPDADSAPVLTLAGGAAAYPELRQMTLDVVAACFAHPSTHKDMPVQREVLYRYQWVLR